MVLSPVANSAVAALSPPDRIARDQGRLAAAQTFGFCLGPVVGVLAYNANSPLPWLGCLAIGAASAAAIAIAPRLARRTGAAPAQAPVAVVAATATPATASA
jgi:hypothetical protein